MRAAIQRAAGDDMAARAHQRDDGQMQRRLTGGNRNRPDAAFERGNALFEHGIGRVREPRIDMTSALHVEKRGRVIRVLEYKRRGLIDRRRAGAGRRVRPCAGMDGKRV